MKFSLTLFVFLISTGSMAQTISGKVTDRSQKPLNLVTVTLKKDSSVAGTVVTGEGGEYTFRNLVVNARYGLSFSFIGFKRVDTVIFLEDNINLTTVLHEQENRLGEVAITGKKKLIERKVDRLIFNVEENVNFIGADGLDILSKTPMVRVEDRSIALVGKSSVAVLVDNKPVKLEGEALASFLKSIVGERIARIEVITNPPAQYDAEGNSGLINIITKRVKTPGYLATISPSLSKNTYSTLYGSGTLNYNWNKFLFVGTVTTGTGAGGPSISQSRFYQDQTWHQVNENKEQSQFLNGTLGLEFLSSPRTSLGISYSGSRSRPDMAGSNTIYIYNNRTAGVDSMLMINNNDQKKFYRNSVNMHVKHRIGDNGKELIFDADYFHNSSQIGYNSQNQKRSENSDSNIPPILYRSVNGLGATGYSINTVMNIPVTQMHLSFGAKASLIRSNSDVFSTSSVENNEIFNSENEFEFDENIQAIFTSLRTTYKRWGMQAGLRAEATQTRAFSPTVLETSRRAYLNLFPTMYLTYKINEKNTAGINYGLRIGRPNFSSFNPYPVYQNQYSYSVGNPELNPSFTNNLELSNTYDDWLNTSLSYSISNHMSSGVQLVENGTGLQVSTVGNFLSSKGIVFSNSMSLEPFKWLSSINELSIYYNKTKSTLASTERDIKGSGADLRTMNSIYLNRQKNLTTGITFNYQFPNVSGLYNYRRYYFFDVTGSYTTPDKKLQLAVALRDVFKTKNVSSYRIINDIVVRTMSNNDSRRIVLNLKYSFGNMKIRKGQSHSISGSEQIRSAN